MLVREIIRQKSRLLKTLWIQLIERKTLANAAGVHVTAELERTELQALGLPVPEIACIPNGVDLPAVHAPLSAGPFANLPERYALFLGRICWKKGLDRLITAWRSVPEIPLVVAGTDDEGYQAKLEALARSVGVEDRVIFVGPASDSHKWALYEHAELFVLPSYSENFGNVVAEAMAMGCPVIVSTEVGIAEIVRVAGAGVVTSGAPDQLAAAITSLSMDGERRREAGRRGRETVRVLLSWDGVAAQTEQLYRRVMRAGVLKTAALA
jgi:glycosyltransferase involved in cell wall biosynthesis